MLAGSTFGVDDQRRRKYGTETKEINSFLRRSTTFFIWRRFKILQYCWPMLVEVLNRDFRVLTWLWQSGNCSTFAWGTEYACTGRARWRWLIISTVSRMRIFTLKAVLLFTENQDSFPWTEKLWGKFVLGTPPNESVLLRCHRRRSTIIRLEIFLRDRWYPFAAYYKMVRSKNTPQ